MKTLSSLRRWQWPIVALLMLFGVALASAPVFAQTGTVIATASPSDATPNVGQQIVVEIRIDMTGVNARQQVGELHGNPRLESPSCRMSATAGCRPASQGD